jgi:triosephosphate isomerase (TIM)
MTRRIVIAGNWKMNKTVSESVELAKAVVAKSSEAPASVDLVVCPTFVSLTEVSKVVAGTRVALGAQDLHWEESGAFTGKISAAMLVSAGVKYVILGHSEQRQFFGETDETVNKKVKQALKHGLLPIICVGELLAEREAAKTDAVNERQLKGAYAGVSAEDAAKTVVAYEPVWAIGTGKVATVEQAQESQAFIRKVLVGLYGSKVAEIIPIQYGGSMKPDNAKGLLAEKDIDGGLIGGAALKADDFVGIAKGAA